MDDDFGHLPRAAPVGDAVPCEVTATISSFVVVPAN
jgi:hypothetical protein